MSSRISARRSRRHAGLCWSLVGMVLVAAVAAVGIGKLLWAALSLLVVALAALPALLHRDWKAIAPWPILAAAAGAAVSRVAGISPDMAGFVSIATLALLIVVELELYTEVELGTAMAIAIGVLTTMAIEALWIIAQFHSDRWLGTAFLTTQTELQEDIVLVTVVGVVVGSVLYAYLAWAPDPDEDTSALEWVGTA